MSIQFLWHQISELAYIHVQTLTTELKLYVLVKKLYQGGQNDVVFFYKKGARKGLDLKNTTATSIKGSENKSKGASAFPK